MQALLRFLTRDAHIPLAEALAKITLLRKAKLNTAESIAQADPSVLEPVFTEEKVLKQVLNAAKRVSNPKKRTLAQVGSTGSKRVKTEDGSRVDDGSSLALPTTDLSTEELAKITIETNRSPLFLAFTIVSLKYTHPEQPLASQLSLAQAVVSAGAQSKAKYIGLTSGPTAEEDGWAQGQPKVKVMGREVAVMRRQVAPAHPDRDHEEAPSSSHDAFWGLDLEALRKSNGPLIAGQERRGQSGLPIHTPAAARTYLLKSMNIVAPNDDDANDHDTSRDPKSSVSKKKASAAKIAARKEEAAAMMLKAIDIVCQSWAGTLTTEELDRRVQSWYVQIRPDVEPGKAGWGQRGHVRLADILKLQRT